MKKKNSILLSEETRTLDVDAGSEGDDAINPYWLAEEPAPHPDPSRGCIRRNLCCRSAPGWFAPGEVEEAAKLKGMTPDAFVREYLIIDYYELDGERVELFAPVKLGRDNLPLIPTATRADRLYGMLRSPCVFFNGEGCGIYGARPLECRSYDCTRDDTITHADIARLWRDAARGEEDEAGGD